MSFLEEELRSQFEALQSTVQHVLGLRSRLTPVLQRVTHLVVLGCGSSYSVAKSTARQIAQMTGIPTQAVAAGDLLVNFGDYKRILDGAAILTLSRSGRTSELVRAVETVRGEYPDQLVISACAVFDAPISRLADVNMEIPWAFDQSVCQTRTVTNLYVVGLLVAAFLANDEQLIDDLVDIATKSKAFTTRVEAEMSELADADWASAVVLADSGMAGLAEEGALAFKEICRTPSSFYHVLDVRHGPIVLINRQTIVLAMLSRGDIKLQSDVLRDIRKQTDHVVAFTSCQSLGVPGVDEICLPATSRDDVAAIFLLYCIQLLCFKRAQLRGLDPDQPEGLAPWINLGTQ